MKQVDRLIIKAKEAAGLNDLRLCMAAVVPCGRRWSSLASLWDGVKGHAPTVKQATHATQDAAVDYLQSLAEIHPNSGDVAIIIDDIPG